MDGIGIPLEAITALGSAALGGFMTLWAQSIKARQAQLQGAIDALGAKEKSWAAARKFGGKEVQWTKRVIALMAVFAVIVMPKLVAVFAPEISVTVGWTEWDPGFWIFAGSNETKWHQATGLVITPLDTHLLSAITGYYFGASVVRNA